MLLTIPSINYGINDSIEQSIVSVPRLMSERLLNELIGEKEAACFSVKSAYSFPKHVTLFLYSGPVGMNLWIARSLICFDISISLFHNARAVLTAAGTSISLCEST